MQKRFDCKKSNLVKTPLNVTKRQGLEGKYEKLPKKAFVLLNKGPKVDKEMYLKCAKESLILIYCPEPEIYLINILIYSQMVNIEIVIFGILRTFFGSKGPFSCY